MPAGTLLPVLPLHHARVDDRFTAASFEYAAEKRGDRAGIGGSSRAELRFHEEYRSPSMASKAWFELNVCVPSKPGRHLG